MKTLTTGLFVPLTDDELMIADGEGKVALFVSILGIAASPIVACANVPAGLALLGTSIGVFVDNM